MVIEGGFPLKEAGVIITMILNLRTEEDMFEADPISATY